MLVAGSGVSVKTWQSGCNPYKGLNLNAPSGRTALRKNLGHKHFQRQNPRGFWGALFGIRLGSGRAIGVIGTAGRKSGCWGA